MPTTTTTLDGTTYTESSYNWNELSKTTQGTVSTVASTVLVLGLVGGGVTITIAYYGFKFLSSVINGK
jgi:hypothetical protein